MSIDADQHALVITAGSVISPSGKDRTLSVASPEDLAMVLSRWKPRSVARTGGGTIPQCWLVGEVVETLGLRSDAPAGDWSAISADLAARLTEFAASLPDWEMRFRPSGGWLYLQHATVKQAVDVVLEPYGFLTSGPKDQGILGGFDDDTSLPDDDHAAGVVLARRLKDTIELCEVMPGSSASATAAFMVAQINQGRKNPIEATFSPPLDGVSGTLLPERALNFTAGHIDPAQLAPATRLVTVDQRAAHLCAAQEPMGWGTPEHLTNAQEVTRLAGLKSPPQAWWCVDIPPVQPLIGTDVMPLPPPALPKNEVSGVWITTATLKWLKQPEGGGGIGYRPIVSQAWVYPHQGKPLADWVGRMRTARIAAVYDLDTDPAADAGFLFFLKRMYVAYTGRIEAPDKWKTPSSRQHIQPYWGQTIIAATRGRALWFAAKIHAEHQLTPLACATDSWTYLVPDGVVIASDDSELLGKYKTQSDIPLTAAHKKKLAAASGDVKAVADALAAITAEHTQRAQKKGS